MFDLNPAEGRVLGCLIEKQHTTPDTYPLTLNALRLACNQSTNREPVVDYSEEFVHDTLQSLHAKGLSRVAGGHGSRATKYRHLLEDELGISDDEAAVLCVTLLRGPQTPGELKQRTERMHRFESLEDLDDTLEALLRRGLAERLSRRPGEKQVRYRHLFGADGAGASPGDVVTGAAESPTVEPSGLPTVAVEAPSQVNEDLVAEIAALRDEVAELRERVAVLESGD